jgi:hypothetical protein
MGMLSRIRERVRLVGQSILRSEANTAELAQSFKRIEAEVARLAGAAERHERAAAEIAAVTVRRQMVELMDDPRFDDPLRLERSGFKVLSQHDEDGIIHEIFRRIGATNRTFVEFGAGDGSENCTGFLLMQGWRGLWIDGFADFMRHVEAGWSTELKSGRLVARNAFVSVATIDHMIREAGFSGEIDLLSVDVDGNDYHFLENIEAVTPRVVCVEYNGNIPADVDWHMVRRDDYIWDGLELKIGASLKALERMMATRGYALVGCNLAGVNAFFVRSDLVADKFASPFTAENHFHMWRPFYNSAGRTTNWREWINRR